MKQRVVSHSRRVGWSLLWGLLAGTFLSWAAPPIWAAGSDSVLVTLRIADQPPDAITNMGASATGTPGEVQLTWTAPSDRPWGGSVASYQIRRATFSVDSLAGDTTAWWIHGNTVDIAGEPVPAGPGISESMFLSSLQQGVTHWFAIRSTDTNNNSSLIDTKSGTPGQQAFAFLPFSDLPAAPTLGIDSAQTTTSQIRWTLFDNATNESGLFITTGTASPSQRISPNLGPLPGGMTYYDQTGLGPNRISTVYGEAFNVNGSSFTAALTRHTLANPPINLTTSAFNTNGGALSWNDNGNPSGTQYVLERNINGAGFVPIVTVTLTNHIDSGFVEGSTHSYQVFARNGDNIATVVSNTASTVIPRIAPDAITDLAGTPGSSNGIVELSWTAVGDDGPVGNITGGRYRIDYSTDPAAARLLDTTTYYVDLATNAVAGQTQRLAVSGLTAGATYYFRVYALDDGLNVSLSNGATAQARLITDAIRPRVVDYSPRSLQSGVLKSDVMPDEAITITFDEAMDPATLSGAFRLTAVRDHMGVSISTPVTGTLTFSGVTLTFRTSPPMTKNYTYTVTLATSAADLAGNFLAEPFQSSFRVVFDHQVDNILVGDDGETCVRIPPGTFGQDGYLRMSMNPLLVPLDAAPSAIEEANEKERRRRGEPRAPIAGSIREFQLMNTSRQELSTTLQRPMELCLPYNDQDNDGFVETAGGRIHEKFLGVVRLDERTNLWVVVPGAEVHRERKVVTAKVPHFSVYAIMPVATTFVGDAFAFPVPFVPTQGHTEITFTNLALDTQIKIYTVSGDLVREIHDNDGDGSATWDVKNDRNEDVFSGVYLYVITSGTEKKTGKLVIVR